MELTTFTQMFKDKNALNLSKLKYKYGNENLIEYIKTLKDGFFTEISLLDFKQSPIVLIPAKISLQTQNAMSMMKSYQGKYGIQAMEDEIVATLSIEQIDTSRESVRNILKGGAPRSDDENKAYGIKKGLDFIADDSNKITAENLYMLYTLSIGDFLDEDSKLIPKNKYRHDAVYVVGQEIAHQGLDYKLLPDYVENLITFIHEDDHLDYIVKSVIVHYYLAYLHPYFDGNGRMSRLLQLWFLVQKGYTSSMFIPFSAYINKSKNSYYKTFTTITDNYSLSNILDITPFINFFIDHVFSKLEQKHSDSNILGRFKLLLENGEITEKEKELFYFVLSAYGNNPFSTKQLEKDYRDVAYATVRSFVMKMEDKGFFTSQKYSNRVKYQLK